MSEFKGTPGPWKAQPSATKPAYNVVGTQLGGKYKIARCPYVRGAKADEQEAKFNAQLISKAPEMLAMLKKVADSRRSGTEVSLFEVERLIKQATTI